MPHKSFARISLLLFLLAPHAAHAQTSRNVTLLAHLNQHAGYSACWSYVHPDGREYAILGTTDGTAIVNVTDPATSHEVAFIDGLPSQWREMKQYQTYVYVATEANGGGIQIIDMADPEHPELLGVYTTGINHEHTLQVDAARARLYCNGTRLNSTQTGMRILSLADPVNPFDIGGYTADYVHDSWPRGDTLYASCINSRTMRVLNVANPAAITEITSWTYPGAMTHSADLSPNGRFLYVCDETNYGTMKVFDIQDVLAHPQIMEISVNPLAIVHNVHVKGDTAFVAYYTEGIRLFDVSDPSCPAEFGWYDTYAGYSGGFHGVWELAPRFPSGTFIASDIGTGLYVFRTNPNYGIAKLQIVEPNGTPVANAEVTAFGESDAARSQNFGIARLALQPGAHTLGVKKFGYKSAVVTVNTVKGAHDSIQVVLAREPLVNVTGVVRRDTDAAPLLGADLELVDAPVEGESTAGGAYTLLGVPGGTYTLRCDRVGYVPIDRVITVQPGVARTADFKLRRAAWYDSCDTDKGWVIGAVGDNATSGLWERADPVGSQGSAQAAGRRPSLAPQHEEPAEGLTAEGPVQPEDDHTPGTGGFCFVTANGIPGQAAGNSDIDFGKTTLTSPVLNMNGMADPYVHFACWYYMNQPGEPDSFVVEISSNNGTSWTKMFATMTSAPFWTHYSFRVRDYITPGINMRVRFIAQDQPPEGIVEAAVDDFEFYDAAVMVTGVDSPPVAAPRFAVSAPSPNPVSRQTAFTLSVPAPVNTRVAVYDLAGREVAVLLDRPTSVGSTPLSWNGQDTRGRTVASGVYWIRATTSDQRVERKVVWVR